MVQVPLKKLIVLNLDFGLRRAQSSRIWIAD
jgi:hypothetical protein